MITVINFKGGVGKTSISTSLALDLNLLYSTNDKINSNLSIEIFKSKNKFIEMNDVINKENSKIIFDGGGFIDQQIKEILKSSNLIIIPIDFSSNGINTLFNSYNNIKSISNKDATIIVIINKYKKNNPLNELKKALFKLNIKEEEIFLLNETSLFEKIIDDEKGILEIINSNNFNKYIYSNFNNNYVKLLNKIKEYI